LIASVLSVATYSKQETSVATPAKAYRRSTLKRFTTVSDAPDTDLNVVCTKRRFRSPETTVLHEKNAD
jgi:hypothetical protein